MAIPGVSSAGGSTGTGSVGAKKNFELKTEDFIKMMITQLQYQDPMEPAKNQELLAQMSQIGQLQSSTQLQETLKGLALQNKIGSAGTLIGKMGRGLDDAQEPAEGLATWVRVEGNDVFLELDNGKRVGLGSVTEIAQKPTTSAE